MTPDVLILFFKYPEPGRVKTRLSVSFGEDFTFGLYSSFIKDILTMSGSVKADKIIVTDVDDKVSPNLPDLGTGYRTIRQKGEDIGIRMLNAFLHVFNLGYHRAVLIGGDSPDLPAEFIERALTSLIIKDAAIGKSKDGGYYLIGFKRETCLPKFFSGISWSTSSVFHETISKMIESVKSIYFLPEWYDIDEKDDLKLFYNKKIQKDGLSLHTIQFINKSIKEKQIPFFALKP